MKAASLRTLFGGAATMPAIVTVRAAGFKATPMTRVFVDGVLDVGKHADLSAAIFGNIENGCLVCFKHVPTAAYVGRVTDAHAKLAAWRLTLWNPFLHLHRYR